MSLEAHRVSFELPEHLYLISLILSDFHDLQLREFICVAIQNEIVNRLEALGNYEDLSRLMS